MPIIARNFAIKGPAASPFNSWAAMRGAGKQSMFNSKYQSFRYAAPFGRIFPTNNVFGGGRTAAMRFGRPLGAQRNFTTGFAQPAFSGGSHQTFANSLSNSLSGLKVFPGALADEVDMKIQSRDDLRSRIRARAHARQLRRARLAKQPFKVSQPTHLNSTMKRAIDIKAVGLGEAVLSEVIKCPSAVVRPTRKRTTTRRAPQPRDHSGNKSVSMSIYLYGPPAWEMETMSNGNDNQITGQMIAEIRNLANLHKEHLTSVANILDKLQKNGPSSMDVREEEGGIYELSISFPRGLSKADVIDYLLVIGVDPCSPHFRLEVSEHSIDMQENTVASIGTDADKPASTSSAIYPAEFAFPWPKAHSPDGSYSSNLQFGDLPNSASDFLTMVDSMVDDKHIFGPKPTVRLK